MPDFAPRDPLTLWILRQTKTRLFFLLSSLMLLAETRAEERSQIDSFYARETIQKVQLTIDPVDLERMHRTLPQRIYVPARFEWGGEVIENVGVRFKGGSSSSPNQQHKRSYLVKFHHYVPGQRFLKLRRVALDNAVQFGGLFSEPIITEILQSLGVVATRCNYAEVYVNEDYQGVFVNVERIDETFVKTHFEGKVGELYKVEGGRGSNLEFLGEEPDAYRTAFEPKTDQAEENFDDVIQFVREVSTGTHPEDAAILHRIIALEDFFDTMAVMLFSGAFDQLTGWGPHNYYLYRERGKQRWHYIASDLDVGFADQAFGKVPVIDGWHAAWPMARGNWVPLLNKIISHPTLLAAYRRRASEILEQYFQPEQLHQKLDRLYELIQPSLARDPHPARRATVPSDRHYDDVVSSMRVFMERRYQLAREQLRHPGERPAWLAQGKPQPPGPEFQPGTHEGGPTDLRVVNRDQNGVHLRWTNNAPMAMGHIVQRAEGEGMFNNLFGLPERGASEARDRSAERGKVYRYRVFAVFPSPMGPLGSRSSNGVVSQP